MATSRAEDSSNRNATRPATHGIKRSAADPLENDQRLAKRFDLLNIDHHGKRYIPIAAYGQQERHPENAQQSEPRADANSSTEYMQVEDTPHKVYVYDLDKELADLESDDETPIFLPDIEKHLIKIPKHVLRDEKELLPTRTNQLVLYNVPSSLTVQEEEQDKVKKAIAEARARVKDWPATQPNKFTDYNMTVGSHLARDPPSKPTGWQTAECDSEAMDIEEL
ncbi:hypothetical protein EJ05DRAFT_541241 [Pseudovirgaria hyperparasitica]|uniref:Uncharacterized protein n=1 Tax=Pseudovirgaria hyperparasitica TaxID=470096 RepID=A0A6A6VTU1_9PEZI|nr:uncharacterized protein EJ05DRAFT_541241 [Pseudovirgaria hyperparasitica]KAF2754108.1 hypothetical protein EJ05DRAFT_541241 [Pseudovirgaria hyperparasitica]